jgi:hypothetical protein
MTTSLRGLLCLILFASPLLGVCGADDSRRPAGDANVLARFEVAKDGDPLLLPVTFKGKTYRFLLDTGSSWHLFDQALGLDGPRTGEFETLAGPIETVVTDAPEAMLGKLSLDTPESVGVLDMRGWRQDWIDELYGIIGMSSLKKHVVRIDFDKGEVLFLKSAGRDSGGAIPLSYDNDRPVVRADLSGWGEETFLLDTGIPWSESGGLRPLKVAALLVANLAQEVGGSQTGAVKGQRTISAKPLRLGEFTIPNPVFRECRRNLLGLDLLSRFVVTFDFPNDTLYLKKGNRFDKTYPVDLSGMHLMRQGGKPVVGSVQKGSAAAAAGFKPNDMLVEVGNAKADQTSLVQLRELFSKEAKDLRVTVRRGNKDAVLTLHLAPAPPKK